MFGFIKKTVVNIVRRWVLKDIIKEQAGSFWDLLYKFIDKYGSKFWVLLFGVVAEVVLIAWPYEVQPNQLNLLVAQISIVVVVVAYFFARHQQETKQSTVEGKGT